MKKSITTLALLYEVSQGIIDCKIFLLKTTINFVHVNTCTKSNKKNDLAINC